MGTCKYINISNNTISGAGTAISMPSSGDFYAPSVFNGWTVDFDNMVSGKAGIYLDYNAKNITMTNNENFYNSAYGIYGSLQDINSATHVLNWNISENSCHTNGQYSGANGYGIYLMEWNYGTYKDIRVLGNRCYNDQQIEAATPQSKGFYIYYYMTSLFANCMAANNDFSDAGQTNTTSNTGWTFSNNLN